MSHSSPRRRKALGQHFLVDEKLADRIVAAAEIEPGERILEIGPGRGVLTERLAPLGKLVAVEKDRWLAAVLRQRFGDELELVTGDALEVELPPSDVVVANLPYNIGTALFTRWMGGEDWPPNWTSLTLMFQQEVAQRIVAKPGSGAYGRLAVLAQWRGTAKLAMKVHRSAFTPPPKVMSAIVHVEPATMPEGVSAAKLEQVTAAAFGQRRKMLRQSLKGVPGALDALEALNIEPTRRAETLDIGEFLELARFLTAAN